MWSNHSPTARAEVQQQAAIIAEVSEAMHASGADTDPDGAAAIAAELVNCVLLPGVTRQLDRDALQRHQRRFLQAANDVRPSLHFISLLFMILFIIYSQSKCNLLFAHASRKFLAVHTTLRPPRARTRSRAAAAARRGPGRRPRRRPVPRVRGPPARLRRWRFCSRWASSVVPRPRERL